MSEKYITLLGVEQIQNAAKSISTSAETMRQMAVHLDEIFRLFYMRMEDYIARLERLNSAEHGKLCEKNRHWIAPHADDCTSCHLENQLNKILFRPERRCNEPCVACGTAHRWICKEKHKHTAPDCCYKDCYMCILERHV